MKIDRRNKAYIEMNTSFTFLSGAVKEDMQ